MLLVVSNEVDPDARWHVEAIGEHLTDYRYYDYPTEGGQPDLSGVDGVVLSGSTAGVYETDDYPWIEDQQRLVCDLVDAGVPTLGVCFGHQLVNAALDGTVEHHGLRAEPVEMRADPDPLLDGVGSVVPAVHGDVVTEPGERMVTIARTDGYPYFATRHRDAPVWSVQFHPEFTAALEDRMAADFGYPKGSLSTCTHTRVYRNFERLVSREGAPLRDRTT